MQGFIIIEGSYIPIVIAFQNGNTAAEVASTNGHNEVLAILGKQLPLTADSTDDLEVKIVTKLCLCDISCIYQGCQDKVFHGVIFLQTFGDQILI